MPKFYRQNKKRINPRYFLNETASRDLEENLMTPEQKSINARPVYYRLQKLLNKPEFSQYLEELDSLMQKVSKTVAKQEDGLSDEEFTELTSASRDDSSLMAFQDRVLKMLQEPSSDADADGDGSSDAEELMQIAQSMKEREPSI